METWSEQEQADYEKLRRRADHEALIYQLAEAAAEATREHLPL